MAGPLGEIHGLPLLAGEGFGVEVLGLALVGLVVHPQAEDVLPGLGDGGQDLHGAQGQGPQALGGPLQHGVPALRLIHEEVVHALIGQGDQGPSLGFQADQGPALVYDGI